jgi:dipeptidyl aminopeptidase/acylaminoacyl peptidase
MFKKTQALLFVPVLLVSLSAQTTKPAAKPTAKPASTATSAALPPIIDRELFFGNPEIAGAQLSPDGQFIAFLKPYKDTRNIWVKRTDEPFSAAKLITADTKRPIPGFFWSRDSHYILFVQDNAGDENFNVYAVNPADPVAEGRDVPPARNLTDAKGARALIYAAPKRDPDVLYVGLNDRDAAWHDLYRVKISTGERTELRKNTERIAGWVFDLDGRLRLAVRVADNGDNEILRVDQEGFPTVYSCSVFETCAPLRFHKDGRQVYIETNKGDSVDLVRLALFDPGTKKEAAVEADPLGRVDFGSARFSEKTDELVVTAYQDDRTRRYFKDKAWEADYRLVQQKLPGLEITIGSGTVDERLWLVTAASDTEPGQRYLFDRASKSLTFQYRVFEKMPREHLAKMQSVRYRSSDGLEIPAYLTLPKGAPSKGLPLIVMPHGGPWARDAWRYDPLAQFLANRGYAVLQPNFRGSTGYGKKFLNAGNLQWGDKMQDDITWGVKHLVSQGIADPKRVGIMGGSYGGYATLAGVAFTPDVYSAAVSIVGPSNLVTLLESIPPYWEAGRKLFHARMGDPTTPEGKKQLERQSPLNAATKIRTPLLVAQGANDPRVKKAESDQIVIALRDRGFPVEYIVAPDEGHGFARPINNLSLFASAEKFFAKHLNGPHQEDMTTEVSARLREITVDPKTVALAKKVDPASVAAPKPTADLRPGTDSYQAKIEAGGQTITMSTTTAIAEENGAWVITETAKMPMGEAKDTTTLEKGTLLLRKRVVRQGPVAVDLSFDDKKVTGTMSMGGQSKPVSVDLDGALFADGAGAFAVLATLPLAEGYTATFRNFNVQRQKATLKQLKVLGIEEVTVPAGAFKTYKLELKSAEGEPGDTTVWIATDTRKVVKIAASLPQMAGAKMTSELVP